MKKYIARVLLEAETPLHIGSGLSDLTLDAPVNCDANGLPQINGTSLAGVLRSSFDDKSADKIFGCQNKKGGEGSRLVVSNAHLVYEGGKVIEGLMSGDEITESKYLKAMQAYALPLRDHCRIGGKGTAADTGKFDNCVLPKGVRFMCEVELTEENENLSGEWEELLSAICSDDFRVGGKVRSGLGKLKVVKCVEKIFDFGNQEDVEKYLAHSASFNAKTGWEVKDVSGKTKEKYICYTLDIQPENFFTFGSGYGDNEVDMTPKKEAVVEWGGGKPRMCENNILVPASSIKGAISHRTAFYYNKLCGIYAGEVKADEFTGANNEAVKALFGCDKKVKGTKETAAGKVYFSDMLIREKVEEKIFNHVAIDRFTGGAISGKLFDEKVCGNGFAFEPMKIYVEKSAFGKEEKIKKAFEKVLDDICSGMLPLGGSTMRGHGCFAGTWKEEGND